MEISNLTFLLLDQTLLLLDLTFYCSTSIIYRLQKHSFDKARRRPAGGMSIHRFLCKRRCFRPGRFLHSSERVAPGLARHSVWIHFTVLSGHSRLFVTRILRERDSVCLAIVTWFLTRLQMMAACAGRGFDAMNSSTPFAPGRLERSRWSLRSTNNRAPTSAVASRSCSKAVAVRT